MIGQGVFRAEQAAERLGWPFFPLGRRRATGAYSKYPFTSRMNSTVPSEAFCTVIPPLPSRARLRTALLARVVPGVKLIVLGNGCGKSAGYSRRKPPASCSVTVTLTESAFAPAGTPQEPVSTKVRCENGC